MDNINPINDVVPPKIVVIIGAGIGGITAARCLSDWTNNFEILVLEANPKRLGGRIWSFDEIPNFPDAKADMGASWLHGGSDNGHPIRKLAEKYGIRLLEHDFSKHCKEQVFDLNGKICSSEDVDLIGYTQKVLLESYMKFINGSNNHLGDVPKDDISFKQAFEQLGNESKKIMDKNIIKYFDLPSIESYHGATIDKVSLTFCEGVPNDPNEMVFEDAHDLVPIDGYSQFIEKLISNSSRNFSILTDRTVKSIKYDFYGGNKSDGRGDNDTASIPNGHQVVIEATNSNGENFVYKADHVIIALPLGVLKLDKVKFNPPLSKEHATAIRNIGFGNFVKALLVFDEVFWPKNSPLLCTESAEPTGFPVAFINMYTINGLPALLAIINSEGAKVADLITEKEIVKKILDRLKLMYGPKVEEKLTFTKIVRWSKEPNFWGAYSFAQIGMTKEDAYNIRKSINGRLFFAGEHTSMPEAQHGTVLGAYLSGLRAAKELLIETNVHFDALNFKAPHEEQ